MVHGLAQLAPVGGGACRDGDVGERGRAIDIGCKRCSPTRVADTMRSKQKNHLLHLSIDTQQPLRTCRAQVPLVRLQQQARLVRHVEVEGVHLQTPS